MRRTKKTRMLIPIFIAIFAVILISTIIFVIDSFSANYINYSNIDESAEKVSDGVAKDADVIILNGVLIGASKQGNWVSANRFYSANSGANELEVNLYSKTSLYGTFKTAIFKKHKNQMVYTTIAKDTLPEEYLAVSSNISKSLSGAKQQEPTKIDEEYVTAALGSYTLLNGGVNVTEVYTASIQQNSDRIICATAKKANLLGLYSAVVYVTDGKATLVKYSYVRDIENSDRWPVYSLKYIHDLDGEGIPELVLEEITGNDVRYTVLELRNNNTFYQVLSTSIEI